MDYLIAIDLGTSHAKALAMRPDGALAGPLEQAGYTLFTPFAGQAEQDPGELFGALCQAVRGLTARISGRPIGLALSGAMHSLLPVDGEGAPLARATTWADQRAAGFAAPLRTRADLPGLYRRTGCPVQALYYPVRLAWQRANNPAVWRAAQHWCGLKDWVVYQLTGAWRTDYGIASATGLLDIHRLAWDEEALDLAGLCAALLPELAAPHTTAGTLLPGAAARLGLPAELPVVVGSSDGALANLGAGVSEPGRGVITVGTSGAVRQVVDRPKLDDPALQRTWCYAFTPGRWFAGGAVNNAGLVVQWVREKWYTDLPGDKGYAQLFQDADSILPGAEGLLFLPYLTGERNPLWNPGLRATLHHLGLNHTRAHVARAALEAAAACLAEVWQALHPEPTERPETVRLTGSITRSPGWCQVLADMIGARLEPLEAADASAIGAGLVGLHALGLQPHLASASAGASAGQAYAPDPARHRYYQQLLGEWQAFRRRLYDE